MTQEVLTALGASAPAGEGDRNPVGAGERTEDLSFRTSDRVTGVGIRIPGEETEDADCHGQCEHWPRNDRGAEEETDCHASVATLARNDGKQAEGLSSRTSPQTGVAIRSPQEDEETDCHASVATLARNDGEEAAGEADAFLREHFARLCAQGEELRREDPSFDLDAALHDPAFLRLTAPGMGVDVRRAWTALHPETLERRAAADAGGMLARSLSTQAARPREGGGQGGGSLDTDYRRLSRPEQLRLKQRIYNAAALGEKIYP